MCYTIVLCLLIGINGITSLRKAATAEATTTTKATTTAEKTTTFEATTTAEATTTTEATTTAEATTTTELTRTAEVTTAVTAAMSTETVSTPPTTAEAVPPSPRAPCDPPWIYNGVVRKCYLPVYGRFTFNQAWFGCVSLWHATVAMPMNPIENYVVNSIYTTGGAGPYWIGLRKIYDYWLWPDSYPFGTIANYINWAPGEPSSNAGTDITCAVANVHNIYGQWSARRCNQPLGATTGVVCQKEPNI